jgi:DNA polymerase III alpha subunit
MQIDKLGNVIYQDHDILDLIYQNKTEFLDQILVEDSADITKLAQYSNINIKTVDKIFEDISVEEFDAICQQDWFIPDEYKHLDIEAWILTQTPPWDPEATRVQEELDAFRQRNMLPLLCVLKYLVDTLRSNNIVWGVGRGSSVASYVLYLIGVHKIDSIKYNLDWREFLR